jgi:hypothetical protein
LFFDRFLLSSVFLPKWDAPDCISIFSFFYQQAQSKNLACYYWNLGYKQLQNVSSTGSKFYLTKSDLDLGDGDILSWLLDADLEQPAIYLFDDLCNFDEIDRIKARHRESQIQNILHKFSCSRVPSYLILLGDYVQFSSKLSARVPTLKYPLSAQ